MAWIPRKPRPSTPPQAALPLQPLPTSGRRRLEPRLMFDAAAALTLEHAIEAAAEPPAPAPVDDGAALMAALAAAPDATAASPAQVAFVSSTLQDAQGLAASLGPQVEVVMLDPARDGLTQIRDALAGRQDVAALHLFTHGSSGSIDLGGSVLAPLSASFDAQRPMLTEIGTHLAAGADVLVYGCDFGQGESGQAAMQALSQALGGADVAASVDATGASALGGDWTLEARTGAIEATALDAAGWNGLLTTFEVNERDSVTITLSQYQGLLGTIVGIVSSESYSATGLPTGLSINSSTGTISGTVSALALENHGNDPTFDVVVTKSYRLLGLPLVTLTQQAAFVIDVADAAPAVSAPSATQTLAEDGSLGFSSAAGNAISVSDPDDSSLTVTLGVAHGTLSLSGTTGLSFSSGDGSADRTMTLSGSSSAINAALQGLTYQPDPDYNGSDALSVSASDGDTPRSGSVALSIGAQPDGANDTLRVLVNTPTLVNPLLNDGFEDPSASIVSVGAASHGTVLLAPGGLVSYTPFLGYTGSDSFTYTVSAGGTTETATVNVTVALNTPPIAVADVLTVNEDGSATLDVRLNDIDPDGQTLSVASATASHGSVTLNPDGTLTYVPAANYHGIDSIGYTLSDGAGGSASSVVAVTVRPQIDLPTLTLPTLTLLAEDTPLLFAQAGGTAISVGDIDGDLLQVRLRVPDGLLTLGSTTNVTLENGSNNVSSDITIQGLVADINAALDGLVWQPGRDHNGSVTLTIDLGPVSLPLAVTATLPIGIAAVADIVDDHVHTLPGQAVSFNVLANDSFENGGRVVSGYTVPAHGSVTIAADGSALYTPDIGHTGTDSFQYTVTSNGTTETATVTLSVTAVNQAPVLTLPASQVLAEDSTLALAGLSVADSDGDALTLALEVAHGRLVLGSSAGLGFIEGDGSGSARLVFSGSAAAINAALATLEYRPDADYHGADTLTLGLDDGALSHAGSVALTVTPVTDGSGEALQALGSLPVVFDPLADDAFENAGATVVSVSGASHGTVVLGVDGRITYTALPLHTGSDSFSYTVRSGGADEVVTVTVDVATNLAPTAGLLADVQALAGATVSIATASAFDDGNLLTHGDRLSFSATGLPAGLAIDATTGLISGTLADDSFLLGGTGVVPILVTATDLSGASTSTALRLLISNALPVAVADLASVDEDSQVVIDVLANDQDPNGGTLSVSSASALHGQVDLLPDGTLRYTPDADFAGADVITYVVVDGQGGSATATASVTVNALNDLPTIRLPALTPFAEDTPLVFASVNGTRIEIGDVDGGIVELHLDVPEGTLTLGSTAGITFLDGTADGSGSLRLRGSVGDIDAALDGLIYTPGPDYNGSLTLGLRLTDGLIGTPVISTALLNIAPVADIVDDQAATTAGTAVAFNLLSNDSFENAARVVSGHSTPAHGTVTISASGQALYTPTAGFIGTDSFQYTVTSSGTTETATVTVVVSAAPDQPPQAVDDTASTPEDTPVTIDVLANDSDPDGDPLSVTAASVDRGQVAIQPDGRLLYTPPADFSGTATISYTVADPDGATRSATVTVSVTPVNDSPVVGATPGTQASDDAEAVSLDASAFFSDPDGDALIYSASGLPPGLSLDPATGLISGRLDSSASASGPYAVTLTATDPSGARVSQSFSWSVANTTPNAANDTATTAEDSAVTLAVLANDSDLDGDALSVVSASAAHGSVVINPDGSLRYTPHTDFSGTDTLVYRLRDADGAESTAVVSISVAPVNDAPDASPLPDRSAQAGSTQDIDLSSFFSDRDGDALTYSASGLPPGLVLDPASGRLSGTLPFSADAASPYTVTLTATDPGGAAVSRSFSWLITQAPPAAVDDTASTAEDTPVTLAPLANDAAGASIDPASLVATHGSATLLPDGSLRFTPAADFSGQASVAYTVSTPDGRTGQAVVTITVSPVDDAPIASPPIPTMSGSDGQAGISLDASAFFSDPDGDALTYTASGLPPGLSIDPTTGLITGTIAAGASASGPYAVVITATDPSGRSDQASFSWSVANPAPTASNDSATTAEDSAVTIAVLANDSDPDGDALTVISASAAHGSVVINPDGSLRYTPNVDFSGTDTIVYQLRDADGATASATVVLTVTAANDAPVSAAPAGNLSGGDGHAVSLDASAFFSDPDGDALSYSASGLPSGLSLDPATGRITGTIASSASASGPYAVTLTATDPSGASVSQNFTWTIANTAPTASNDSATTTEDTAVTIAVLANDSDPDGDALSVIAASAAHGSVVINPDGSLRYTPDADFFGTDTLVYQLRDADGATSSATVVLTVTAANDAPVSAAPAGNLSGGDGHAVSLDASAFFSDPDGDALTYSASGLPPGLSFDPATGRITGTIASSASASGPYTVTLTATDPSGTSVSQNFTWTIANTAPVAANDSATTAEDSAVTIAVLANDSDPDGDALSVVSASAAHGSVVINPDGSLRYTPHADFSGTDTLVYRLRDADGAESTAVVSISVAPVNDAPVAVPLPDRTAQEGTSVSIETALAFTDREGDALSYSAAGLPPGLSIDPATGRISGTPQAGTSGGGPLGDGVYTITVTATDPSGASASTSFDSRIRLTPPPAADDSAITAEDTAVRLDVLANDEPGATIDPGRLSAMNGQVILNPDGSLTFTPDPDFNGTALVRYGIIDGGGAASEAVVTITVTAVNDAPIASPPIPTMSGSDGQAGISLDASAFFSDPDGDALTYTASGLPPGLSIDPASGLITGTLSSSASASSPYAVVITATDPGGRSDQASFSWSVANPAPTASNDSATTAEDSAVTIAVLANDSDPDGDALSIVSASASHGSVVINPDGSLRYAPNADFSGTDTLVYQLRDADGATASATVVLTVTAANDAPVSAAPAGDLSSGDGHAVSLDAAAFFSDPDGDALSYSATGLPPGLSLDPATGRITGTIDSSASASGPYAVTLTATDPSGASVSQNFTWTIANTAPTASNDSATTAEDTAVTIAVLANDSDPDGDALSVVSASASHGSVVINPDGSLRYTPNADFSGTDTIVYQLRDADGATASTTVVITVTAANDAPISATPAGNLSGGDGHAVSLDASAFFSDPDGDALTYSASGLPPGLSLDPATGLISGRLDSSASASGPYAVTLTATDPSGARVSQSFSWSVANTTPNAANDTATTAEDSAVTIAVLANDSDLDGDALSVVSASAAHGSVVINPDGSLRYTPDADFSGTDTLVYRLRDADGAESTAVVSITVAPANDAPDASPLPDRSAQAGSAQNIDLSSFFSDRDGDTLTYTASGLPPGLSIDPATGRLSGTLSFSADAASPYTVTLTATDPSGAAVSRSFSWLITQAPPAAADDTASTAEDTPVTLAPLANDAAGATIDPASLVATHGSATLLPDGSLRFTPAADFSGQASIAYTVSTPDGRTGQAVVTITVSPVDDAPIASPPIPTMSGSDGQAGISLDASAFFSDPDGDALTYTASGLPPGLSIDSASGLITGTLSSSASASSPYAVVITATDPSGRSDQARFSWTVANPAPVATNDSASTDDRSVLQREAAQGVLANDADPDGDSLQVVEVDGRAAGVAQAIAGSHGGRFTLEADGSYRFDPAGDFADLRAGETRSTSLSYRVDDGQGGSATATLSVRVVGQDDAPQAQDLSTSLAQNQPLQGRLLATDPEGDALVFSIEPGSGPQHGTLQIDPDGRFTLVPEAGFSGSDRFVYRVTDAAGLSATGTVTLDILPATPDASDGTSVPNQPPTLAEPLPDREAREGDTLSIAAGAGFSDREGAALGFTATGLPPGLSIDPATGTLSGTVASGAASMDSGRFLVSVQADDGAGGRTRADFVLLVQPALVPPPSGDTGNGTGTDTTTVAQPPAMTDSPQTPVTSGTEGAAPETTAQSPADAAVQVEADATLGRGDEIARALALADMTPEFEPISLVLNEAVNRLRSLEGAGEISAEAPMQSVIGQADRIGSAGQLDGSAPLMQQATAAPISKADQIREATAGPFGINSPIQPTTPAPTVDPALPDPAEPVTGASEARPAPTAALPAPESFAVQLARAASARDQEIEALALALGLG